MNFKRFHESKNLFDKSTVLSDYYINDSNGNVSRNTSYNVSASMPIDVEGLEYIYPNTNGYTGIRQWAAFYNGSGNYISGFNGYNVSIKVPSNAKTVRFTVSNTYIDAFSVNAGSQPLPYEPYSSEVWHDIPHYIMGTSTDTITTPADIYVNDTSVTVEITGNTGGVGDLVESGERAGEYIIPIINNGVAINVYNTTALDVSETLSATIPTTDGANTLSIGTTVQPSEVTATYKGWHPVQSVHERENGQWD